MKNHKTNKNMNLPKQFTITMPAKYGFPKNSASVRYDDKNFVFIMIDKNRNRRKIGEKDLLLKIESGDYIIDTVDKYPS